MLLSAARPLLGARCSVPVAGLCAAGARALTRGKTLSFQRQERCLHCHSGAALQRQGPAPSELKDVRQIPGPKPLPLLGNTFYMLNKKNGFDPQDFSVFWKQLVQDFGPIVKLKIVSMPQMVVTLNPDDVQTFLRPTPDHPTRFGFSSIAKIRREDKTGLFKDNYGLLTENGPRWWHLRRRVQAPLLRPKNVAMYLPAVDGVACKFMDRIELVQAETGRVPDDFTNELFKWALESIALVALDGELGCLAPQLAPDSRPLKLIGLAGAMLEAMTEVELGGSYLWKLWPTAPYRHLAAAHAAFVDIALEAIQEAEARLEEAKAPGEPDRQLTIMETFLRTDGLSRSEVATMILDLIMGGIETTSLSVGYALYLLARNPEAQRRLQQQVDAVVRRDEPLMPEHLAALDCIVHVIKETLRLYPVAFANARLLTRDAVLSGYRVPAGTFVLGLSGLVSRMEEHFPRPLEFLPERWQRDRPYGAIHPFASLPFSHGTRMCIGKRLAEQEMYVFLIRAMQRYTVTYELDHDVVVQTQLVAKPVTPLAFKFHPRTDAL